MKLKRRNLFQKHVTAEALLQHVDLDKAIDAPENQDKTPEQIADAIIDTIAAATPWSVIIPGIGALIDAVEARVLKSLVHAIIVAAAKKKRQKATESSEPTQTSAATSARAEDAHPGAGAAGDLPPADAPPRSESP